MDAILEADRKAPRKQQHTAHRGMRREELVQLKIEQIDSACMLIHIRQSKGQKDRDVMLSARLLQELRDYWRTSKRKPTIYLFPSQGSQPNDDVPMTSKSVWDAVHQAATRAGLDKCVHPHTLRQYAASRTMPRVGASAAIHGHLNGGDAAWFGMACLPL